MPTSPTASPPTPPNPRTFSARCLGAASSLALVSLGALLALISVAPLLYPALHLAPALTPATLPAAPVYRVIIGAISHLDALLGSLTPPNLLLFRHVMGFMHTVEIYAAVRLGVADALHSGVALVEAGGGAGADAGDSSSGGSGYTGKFEAFDATLLWGKGRCLPASELARVVTPCASVERAAADPAHCGAVALRLTRLLRATSAYGVFREAGAAGSDCWVNTALSHYLRAAHPDSMRAVVLNFGDLQFKMMNELPRGLVTGEAPFRLVHGEEFWQYYKDHPAHHAIFDATMRQLGRLGGADAAIARDVPWANIVNTVVDVGGGQGGMVAGIVRANPRLGGGIVFDMPHVIARARALWAAPAPKATADERSGGGGGDGITSTAFEPHREAALVARISFVEGDMFEPSTLPAPRIRLAAAAAAGEAALRAGAFPLDNARGREAACDHLLPGVGFVLRDILHDWTDDDSVRILASLRRAMRDNSTLCYPVSSQTAGTADPLAPVRGERRAAPAGSASKDRVFVVARVVYPGVGFVEAMGSNDADLVMLANFGSTAGERTLEHFGRLFAAAGLELVTAHATRSHYRVLEARAVGTAPEADAGSPGPEL